MDPIQRFERRGEAQRRRRAQRHRVGLLRSRVVALSLIGFVFLWGVVFVQMATGNDPVLGSGRGARAAAGAAASEATGSTEPKEAEPEEAEPESAEPQSVEPQSAEPEPEPEYEYVEPEPAPVITSQS